MKRVSVIKIGGGLVSSLSGFWDQVRALRESHEVVLVHGGGPQATAMARRLGHEPTIVHGRRVTTDLDLDIVRWTMRGEINLSLVAAAQGTGIPAAGLSGADGGTLQVGRRPPREVDGRTVDFGWVGDVQAVDARLLQGVLSMGFMPVVAPIGIDTTGQIYNVNADTVAVAIARELAAQELLLVTEAGCLRRGITGNAPRVPSCDRALFREGIDAGWIEGGMRVKIQLGLEALEGGIHGVWVCGPDDVSRRDSATRIAERR